MRWGTRPFSWQVLLLTFQLSLVVTAVALGVGYPLAYYMVNVMQSRLLRRLSYIIVVTPLFTSNIVRSFGWMVLLSRQGLINHVLLALGIIDRPLQLMFTQTSIIIGLAYISAPFMVLTIASRAAEYPKLHRWRLLHATLAPDVGQHIPAGSPCRSAFRG